MVYAQPRINPGEWDAQTLVGFWDTNGSPNLSQTTGPQNNQQEKKENLPNCGLWCPGWSQSKIERKRKDKYLDLARELKKKKTVAHESDGDTNCNWCSWYSHQRIGTETGGLQNKRTSGDNPNYSIIEISQNTKKNWEDITVTQTPVRNHRLTLVWTIRKGANNNNDNKTKKTTRTSYVKAKIDKTQQHNKCRLWGDGDKTINHIISTYNKLALKRLGGKVDPLGIVQEIEIWSYYQIVDPKPESVLENETHWIL